MADPREVDAVSGPPIYPQLHYAFAHRLDIAKIAERDSREPRFDPRTRLPVSQTFQPVDEGALAGGRLIVTKIHGNCNL